MKAQTIVNCFRKGGFRVVTACEESTESKEPASQESNKEQALLEVGNSKSYIRINDDVPCYNDDNTLEESIIEALSSKRPCLEDGSEHKDSDLDGETISQVA